MKISRFSRVLSLGLGSLLMLSAVGMTGAQSAKKVLNTAIEMVGADPETIDPNLTQDTHESQITQELFLSVTRLNESDATIQPGLAKSWDVSADGKTITYHLMDNVPWVHYNADTDAVEEVKDDAGNVRMVTAQDFVYSWTRAFDPATASPYEYALEPYVLGATEFRTAPVDANGTPEASFTPDPSVLKIKAVDDHTFEVQMPEAVGFAPLIHGLTVGAAVPQWAVEAGGDSWTEPENIVTNGPFALKTWAHDESVTLVKNPFWPGTDAIPQPKIDEVTMPFIDQQTQFAQFQAGSLDAAEVPIQEIDHVKSDPTLSKMYSNATQLATYYVGFNTTKPPMNNVHIRRALSYAIDRQSIVDNVTKGGQIPARWFARPGLNAAPTLDTNPTLGLSFDVAKAKEELAAGLKDLGLTDVAGLPPITLSYNDSANHAAIMQAIQQMWSDNLGITVQLSPMDGTTYFTLTNQDATQAFRSGWNLDYPDANNFDYDVMRSTSSQNGMKYNNPAFDALVDQARLETDTDKRRDLYAKAEDLLVVQDAAIAPIYWYTTNQITQNYVERTHSVTGFEAYEKWDITK
jgi:oligopeptide transport system substrate-binding protein